MPYQFELPFESSLRLLTVDEIYSLQDASLLKAIAEDRRIERKPVGIHSNALALYFSMWANTPPCGGIIAIGITDRGETEGILKSSSQHVNDLERTGDVYCPDARYETKRVRVRNKEDRLDEILLIRVFYNERKMVRLTDGKVWTRRGGSKRELKEEEVREIQIEKGELSWEREPSEQRFPDDFDTRSIQRFAEAVIDRLELEHTASTEEILVLRHLGETKNGRFIPNKACALLFSRDPANEIPGCRIRFLRFDGKDEGFGEKYNATKDVWIEGNIPSQLVEVERVAEGQFREFSHLGRDGKFITSPEYPKAAWYEAIVNAVCHRSYNMKNASIFVKMFDDRLEVESPGGFLPFVTPDNIYDQHEPRNPDFMNALYFFNYVKCAHEGTRRMRQTMQDLQLPPPVFSETKATLPYFKVTLKNNVELRKKWLDADAKRIVGEAIFQTLNEHEMRMINYVAEHGSISVTDAVRITDKAWGTCKESLMGLVERGILQHIHREGIIRDSKARFVLRSAAQPQSK